ncbi:hypothetical protein M404DRAFT_30604 [Pisolithus tinctorius Marx 270]|uniref:Reverse transcriptase n=1 Tax=Pisolithus tinctorius Marx 270 TaxID=870435 RepID=A0A0C3JNR5_PISTI|nr:hypothetical protein M404DRAFT_30604 [Pisolithus tinctorius Marx 270]
MATKTRFQPPHGHSATNPNSASASGACCETALAALGTTRRSPGPISPFRGFSAHTSNTPTPCCPTAPIPEGDPGDDGPGNNDDNNPDDDEPGDNGPGDDNLEDNDLEDDLDFPDPDTEPAVMVFDSLAKAIKLLAHNARTSPESSSRTKLHEPNTFDGTDPKKLRAFFIQCELNFQDHPRAFRTDHTKVIFAQSYLKGMALEWFEPDLLGLDDPDNWPLWMDSWREFVLELQTTFGPHNPVTDAESQLDHLHMKDSQCINKYIVDFNQLASQVQGYGDGDEVCRVGKPRTLHELRHLAQEIDAHYWERKEEVQQASKHQGLSNSSNNKSGSSSNNSQPRTGQEKAKTGNNNNNNNSGSSPKPASSKPGNSNNSNSSKPEPSKLGKDGKLTPEECKRRIDGNLCMFCRGSGHFADKCPEKAAKAKARAATTTEAMLASGLVDVNICFVSGDVTPVTLYLAPLDSECRIVLGHDWLTRYNPLIDWVLGSLTFWTPAQGMPTPSTPSVSPVSTGLPDTSLSDQPGLAPSVLVPDSLACTPLKAPLVSLINAAAFVHACKLEGKAKASALPPHQEYDLKIELEEGITLPLGTIYLLSLVELQALRTFIDENLTTRFIQPTSSPYAAPVLFVKKKDGSLQLCIDFCSLNKITKKDRYPLPLISDLLDSPSQAKIYTKIDLQHAYHLVWIAPGNEWKTAFRTWYGSYEWLVMPFGLTNAPAAFQHFINTIFADMLDVCVVIYLDDILIYSGDKESHKQHPEKCEFHLDLVEYLGFHLSPASLTMSKEKVQTICDWPEPRKVKDIQSFLGFANFYCRFIFNYSDIIAAFTTVPVLTHFIPGVPITIETDASDYAIAGILSITCGDGQIHPVAFYSQTLMALELNYDTHDKELLAIFEAFQTWCHYLEGSASPVDVVTDHKNLEYFSTSKVLTCCQARWSEFLSQFNMIIQFRPKGDSSYAQVNLQNLRLVFTQEQLAVSLCATYLEYPVLRAVALMDIEKLHNDILTALPDDPVSQIRLSDMSDPRWSVDDTSFLRLDGRIYVLDSNNLCLRVLHLKHDHPLSGHFGQNCTLELIRREYTWPGLRTFIKDYVQSCTACARAKVPCHRPYGLLKQLLVLEKPWNSISMDFIEQLPASTSFTAILVVVDRLSKQAIFIPTHDTITAPELAKLFLLHVFSKHGVPAHVTSDQGSEFISHFFQSLGKALDMHLHFTSGYHPEGDGQTERTNQTLEQYLRVYCNYQQDNWADLLPLAKFAYNNAPSATTGVSPFFANKGYHPNISVYPSRDLTSTRACDYAVDLDSLHQYLREEMTLAQQCYQGPADAKRMPALDFKKLSERNLGLYLVIAQASTHSFTLRLPDSMCAVHPVFHVSQLEPAIPNTILNWTQPPPPPVEVDGELEFEVAEILDSKVDWHRWCWLQYLVQWTGYEGTDEETTWVLATELDNASELVQEFHSRYPSKPSPYQ